MCFDIITVEVITLNVYDNQREAVLLGYMAGIIDGEGTIGINKFGSSKRSTPGYSVRVGFGMTERKIAEMFSEKFGGSIMEERVRNRKVIYRWYKVGNTGTREILETLLPYLIIKRNRAELALGFLDGINTTGFQRNQGLPEAELQRRQDFYLRMKELNATGAPATTNREDT